MSRIAPLSVEFSEACEQRAHGLCEVRVEGICHGRGNQAHHIVTRARGVGWAGLHDPENGVWCCSPCHAWIHAHPFAAKLAGLLKSRPA